MYRVEMGLNGANSLVFGLVPIVCLSVPAR